METVAHQTLKRLALAFLRQHGCAAVATEVRCPISRYRIDVAGYQDRFSDSSGVAKGMARPPLTVAIECKQTRADFLRDSRHAAELLGLRSKLDCIRKSIEEHRIKQLEPQLRVDGSSLFAELDDWDFSRSKLPGYRKVIKRLFEIDQKLHGQTKFFLIARYRLADRLYIASPRGLIRRRELPSGWGLLECPPECLEANAQGDLLGEAPALEIKIESPAHSSHPQRRVRLLRNIAVAASWAAERRSGLVRA